MATEPATKPDQARDAAADLSEVEYLKKEASATREAIGATLVAIKKDARQALDPWIWVRRFPGASAAIAVTAGFGAAWAVLRRRKASRVSPSSYRPRTEPAPPRRKRNDTQSSLAAVIPAVAHFMAPAAGKKPPAWLGGLIPTPSRPAPSRRHQPEKHDRPAEPQKRRQSLPTMSWWQLIKQTVSDWMEDKAPRLGAALAYYTIFSIAPLLVIALAIAGMVFGADAVQGELHGQLQSMLGEKGAAGVEDMIAAASKPKEGTIATIVGVVVLLFGASGVFGQLQDALNTIWEVQPKPRGIWGTIKDRFFSFVMVLGTGFLLLVSLALSAAINLVAEWMGSLLPLPEFVLHALNFVVSFAVITALFAAMFKLVPDAEIEWRDVWVGAIATAGLFVVGKFILGMYLGSGSVANAYGAAGSLVVVLLWVYYSAQIVFFGAEFTQVYARSRGSRIKPAANAVAVTQEARAEQGMAPKSA